MRHGLFRLAWKDDHYAHSIPAEDRDDVVRVVLNRDPGVTRAQIAKHFGIHVGTLDKWLQEARVKQGDQPGVTLSEHAASAPVARG